MKNKEILFTSLIRDKQQEGMYFASAKTINTVLNRFSYRRCGHYQFAFQTRNGRWAIVEEALIYEAEPPHGSEDRGEFGIMLRLTCRDVQSKQIFYITHSYEYYNEVQSLRKHLLDRSYYQVTRSQNYILNRKLRRPASIAIPC